VTTTPHAPNGFAWRIVILFGLLTLAMSVMQGFTIGAEVLPIVPLIAVLLAVSFFYRTLRPNRMFAMTTGILAFFMATMLVMGPLSYVVVSYDRPLVDAELAAIDHALGFDWQALQRVTAANWWLSKSSALIYGTSGVQMILAWLVLGWTCQFRRLSIFLGALALSTGTVLLLSGIFPAAGAYVHYGVPESDLGYLSGTGAGVWHVKHFYALRDGSLRHLVLSKSEGLITFPSYHTVVAVLSGWALWRTAHWKWPMTIYSALVVATTLPIGGHHLVDLIAGAAVTAFAVAVVSSVERTYETTAGRSAIAAPRGLATRLVY
jgi:PAP2 superfamily